MTENKQVLYRYRHLNGKHREWTKNNVLSSSDKQVGAFLLTKAKDWAYEEEWRIIDHDRGAGNMVFPAELLVGVILGARMSPDDKRAVAEWVSESQFPVEMFQAYTSKGTFSLEIKPHKF